MAKKYQIFICSTYDDLIEERKAMTQALLECNCIPAEMEQFPPSSKKPWDIITSEIDESDFFFLILAGRYGSECKMDNGDVISYIEREYNYANQKDIPIVVFLYSDINNLPVKLCEQSALKKKRLAKFRNKAIENGHYRSWTTKEDLRSLTTVAIQNLIKSNPNGGWAKGINFDLSKSSSDEKEKVFISLFEEMFIPARMNDLKIAELYKLQFKRLTDKTLKKQYIKSYDREIIIYLRNDQIYIENYWVQKFANPMNEEYEYRLCPWLLPGLEFESYCFTRVVHNKKQINPIQLPDPKKATNSKYLIKYDVRIPFDQCSEQVIIVNDCYSTKYAEFFHTHTFMLFCESFNLSARIVDERADKSRQFILRWQIFPDTDLYRDVSANMMTQKPDSVSFSNIRWMSPGTGYVLTLNYRDNSL